MLFKNRMKSFVTFALLLLPVLVIFSACEKNVKPSSICIGVGDSATFQLKYEEAKQLCTDDFSCIKFVKLVSDSRCPSDVVCVWQGTAVIELETCDAKGGSVSLELNKPVEYIIGGVQYSAKLTALDPYPDTRHPADAKEYVSTIVIKRK